MDKIGTGAPKPLRRHLLSPEAVMRAAHASRHDDLGRSHGHGNGVRMHGVYFSAVSFAALVLVLAAIVLAAAMM